MILSEWKKTYQSSLERIFPPTFFDSMEHLNNYYFALGWWEMQRDRFGTGRRINMCILPTLRDNIFLLIISNVSACFQIQVWKMILEQIQMRKSNTHCRFWIKVDAQVVLAKTIGSVIKKIVHPMFMSSSVAIRSNHSLSKFNCT